MSSKKFISARPDRNHGEYESNRYNVGTNMHLAASPQRQRNLESYALQITNEDNLVVQIVDSQDDVYELQKHGVPRRQVEQIRTDTACIINDESIDKTIIVIPSYSNGNLENPFAELSDEEFRAIIQYANMLHEAGGHYPHTDQPTVNDCFEKIQEKLSGYPQQVQQQLAKLTKDLWNAIEDGAIEEAIRNERGSIAAQRLAVKNSTFIAQSVKEAPAEHRQNISVVDAVRTAAMDLAKCDTGALRRLLDEDDPSWQFKDDEHEKRFLEIYDDLQGVIQDALTIANPAVRTYRIFDFLAELIDFLTEDMPDPEEFQEALREAMQESEMDDTDNQSGQAQKKHSQGLQQNSKQEVGKQQAQTTKQTVTVQTGQQSGDGDSDSSDGSETGDGSQSGQQSGGDPDSDGSSDGGQDASSGDDSTASDDSQSMSDQGKQTSNDGDSGSSSTGTGMHQEGNTGSDADTQPACPSCGSQDTGRLVQEVDGMIAARVNAPFNITADWINSITFVSNNEVCGFRVDVSGQVPRENIEQQGYKVVDVSEGVEILEPSDQYGDTEQVRGFECNSCGHAWVPTIGGEN